MNPVTYEASREVLSGDVRRGSVSLNEAEIARYLGSRNGAGMDASRAREVAEVFMKDVRTAIASRSNVVIRDALPRDQPLLDRLFPAHTAHLVSVPLGGQDCRQTGPNGEVDYWALRSFRMRPDGHTEVIEANGEPAGFVMVTVAPRGCELYEIYIDPAFRRRGIGTAAALACFTKWPNTWQTTLAGDDDGALRFLQRVCGMAAGPDGVQLKDEGVQETTGDPCWVRMLSFSNARG